MNGSAESVSRQDVVGNCLLLYYGTYFAKRCTDPNTSLPFEPGIDPVDAGLFYPGS